MPILTLPSKREATLPKEICESLGLKPGDVITREPRGEGGTQVWALRPKPARARSWVGCLGSRSRHVTDRSPDAIREGIEAGGKAGT